MFCYVNASGRIASGPAARLSPLDSPTPPPLPALFPHLGHGITARRKMLCAAARFAPPVKFPRDSVAAAPPRKALPAAPSCIPDILQNVAYRAIQNKAKRINRFCADRLPMLHPMNGVCRYSLLKNQLIFRHVFSQQRFKERPV